VTEAPAIPTGPELFFGLIGALGSPIDELGKALERALARVAYGAQVIHLSKHLPELGTDFAIDSSTEDKRIGSAMHAGTLLRERLRTGEAMAWLAVSGIRGGRGAQPRGRRAFILRSLKHQAELERLRAVYQDQFIAIAIHAPRAQRVDRLAQQFAASSGGRPDDFRDRAEKLISVDEKEIGTKLGQNVRKIFPEADLFVTPEDLDAQLDRFVDLLFGRPVVTPSPEEVGMFHAQAAAMRSAALGRQVGAAIATTAGDVIATGCNEVPRSGGGQYWDQDDHDGRDFTKGKDQSDHGKRFVLRELLTALRDSKHLSVTVDIDGIVNETLGDTEPPSKLADTAVANLTEFTRDVHAETAAVLTTARLGIAVRGCILYATTFPCHNCAKHIVAAGIAKVVYREPYPKSYARDFYTDSIEVDGTREARVPFVPFKGVSPRRYMQWFAMRRRKGADGNVIDWRPAAALPGSLRKGEDPGQGTRELGVMDELEKALKWLSSGQISPASAGSGTAEGGVQ